MFVSTQARILAIVAILNLITSFAAGIRTSGVVWAIVSFLVGIIVLLVMVMDQDCVVTGGCNIWGWIKFTLTAVVLVISIVLSIMMVWKGKEITITDDTKDKEDDSSSHK